MFQICKLWLISRDNGGNKLYFPERETLSTSPFNEMGRGKWATTADQGYSENLRVSTNCGSRDWMEPQLTGLRMCAFYQINMHTHEQVKPLIFKTRTHYHINRRNELVGIGWNFPCSLWSLVFPTSTSLSCVSRSSLRVSWSRNQEQLPGDGWTKWEGHLHPSIL